jgi:hypothetical protein
MGKDNDKYMLSPTGKVFLSLQLPLREGIVRRKEIGGQKSFSHHRGLGWVWSSRLSTAVLARQPIDKLALYRDRKVDAGQKLQAGSGGRRDNRRKMKMKSPDRPESRRVRKHDVVCDRKPLR